MGSWVNFPFPACGETVESVGAGHPGRAFGAPECKLVPARKEGDHKSLRPDARISAFTRVFRRAMRGPGGRPYAAALLGPATIAAFTATTLAAGDRELGQYLSSECVTCHQLSGKFQGIPPIVGWPEASFVEIMNEYRAKRRENPVMQTIAGKLSQEEIAALAAYFGSLRPQWR